MSSIRAYEGHCWCGCFWHKFLKGTCVLLPCSIFPATIQLRGGCGSTTQIYLETLKTLEKFSEKPIQYCTGICSNWRRLIINM
ncbi:hypothetical protein Nepgr_011276 [Nepenthes gracilis]|uniref:Uncharacterized protein n=1 Tax=Nepenthes gracilis TaxID=150966 RepID=A0AAD3XM62_NEPGR|nr:hypothetical protein Nepgr_011276 [Nepenthes gracilis]